jgi:hypothetical protein
LDHVCRSATDGWFYAPDAISNEFSNVTTKPHQPTATLLGTTKDTMMMLPHDNLNGFDVDDRIQFHILNNSTHLYNNNDNTCTYDPTPNHLIAQSIYNEMMGEFYVRTVMGLNRWLRDDFDNNINIDVQIYIHFVEKYNLFEGHQLFLGGMPNNNHFESFLSLMPTTTSTTTTNINDVGGADGASLTTSSQCRCFTKLIFCGYYIENSTTILSDNVTKMFGGHMAGNSPEFKDRVRRKFDPDDVGVSIGFKPYASIGNPATSWSIADDNFAFRDLRNDLFVMHSQRFDNLDEKILQYKMNILDEMGLLGSNNNNHTTINKDATAAAAEKWKLIGFARRKSRRLWLNINDIMSMCSEKFQQQYQVACIIVDVEEATSPEEQLIMHRSLFALIGVHGAQLTQGVLLPSHGNILEILPWIPSYCIGGWVASTSAPTPLGVLYHNTDINHYGYALGRNSTPLCAHVNMHDENATKECLTNNADGTNEKFQWDVRNFTVPVHVIEDFLTLIILQQYHHVDIEDGNKNETTEGVTTCDDMRVGAKVGNFVLYNAYCRQSVNESSFVTEHYYRERE